MNILFILIPLSLVLVVAAAWAFFWAVDSGQFDDMEAPGWDVLSDDATGEAAPPASCSTARVNA